MNRTPEHPDSGGRPIVHGRTLDRLLTFTGPVDGAGHGDVSGPTAVNDASSRSGATATSRAARASRPIAAALGALAGASIWLSAGVFAVTDAATRTRIGALPPLWALVLLAALGASGAVLSRLPAARLSPLVLTALLWLPWLPVPVPSAFLLWTGPLALIVWLVVLLGLIAPLLRVPSAATDSRRAPAIAAVLAFVAFSAGGLALSTRIPAGDEPHYLVITQSLWLDGDLRIENNHERGDYHAYFPGDLGRPAYLRRGTDDEIYSVHMPGTSVAVLPAFVTFGYPGAREFVALVCALGSALAWHAAWLATGSAGAAWVGWAAVAFSPPMFFHAFTIYPDTLGATLTMFIVWLLVRSEREGTMGRAWLLAAGAALGSLPWLHTRFAVVAAGLGIVLGVRVARPRDRLMSLTALFGVPVLAAAAWFGYFWSIYGSPNPSIAYNGMGQNQLAWLASGVPGLLVDQQFGLLANAPVFIVAALATIALIPRAPALVLGLLATYALYFVTVASYGMWWAGHSAPARFLLVLLWPAVIPIAAAWRGARSAAVRAAIGAGAAVGFALTLGRAKIDSGGLLYNVRDGYDLLLDWASRTVNLPLAFPSLHRDSASMAVTDASVWAICAVLACACLHLSFARRLQLAAKWTATAAAAAASLMLASTVVWARYPDRVVTPETSQLDFLHRWRPRWQTVGVMMTPVRLMSGHGLLGHMRLTSARRGPEPPADESPLLELPQVPAGRYAIELDAEGPPAGTVHLRVGDGSGAIEEWPLEAHSASRPLMFELPVPVRSIVLEGDEGVRRFVRRAELQPVEILPPDRQVTARPALRAAKYGLVRVFFLDNGAFMEWPGFWTHGEGQTHIIVDGAGRSDLVVRVRSGAAPTGVSIDADGWRRTVMLKRDEVREITIPGRRDPRARLVTLTTASGFRPSDVEPGNGDRRLLGVWVEFP